MYYCELTANNYLFIFQKLKRKGYTCSKEFEDIVYKMRKDGIKIVGITHFIIDKEKKLIKCFGLNTPDFSYKKLELGVKND